MWDGVARLKEKELNKDKFIFIFFCQAACSSSVVQHNDLFFVVFGFHIV